MAIQIAHSSLNFSGSGGADNNGNDFFGAKFEANEWDLICDNPYTAFFGNGFSDIPRMDRNGVGGNALPTICEIQAILPLRLRLDCFVPDTPLTHCCVPDGGASSGGYSYGGGKCCGP